jgi:hypothetical protein
MDGETPYTLPRPEPFFGRIVDLTAGDDLDFVPAFGKCKRKIRQHLAGRGVVRIKVAVEENKAHSSS